MMIPVSITRPSNIAELKAINDCPTIIANNQGLITYINKCFEDVLEWTPKDLKGELITIILPSSFRDSHNLAFSRFQSFEQASVLNHPVELITVTKSQKEIVTEHYIIAEKIEGEWIFGAMLRLL